MVDTNIKYTSAVTVLSEALDSLADSGSVTSTEQSNATAKHQGLQVSVELACAGAATGVVAVYIAGGAATGKTATTVATPNMQFVGSVTVNGTTVVRATFPPILNPPQFYTIHLRNSAGAALAASDNIVQVVGLNYEIT